MGAHPTSLAPGTKYALPAEVPEPCKLSTVYKNLIRASIHLMRFNVNSGQGLNMARPFHWKAPATPLCISRRLHKRLPEVVAVIEW